MFVDEDTASCQSRAPMLRLDLKKSVCSSYGVVLVHNALVLWAKHAIQIRVLYGNKSSPWL